MIVHKVMLPDLYRLAKGVRKKRLAWAYLQRYYPHYDPIPKQSELEKENCLLCTYNYERARKQMEEWEWRQNKRKTSKGGK
ncbi:hypothetical protein GCM10008967_00120 [Bacillus carboniphilus]|uniref:Uncharacterized protein n=1 Tax=Bacillus carboniphilus TaxID=86663 RepID=A0ABN0VNZ5_9BACI